MGQRPYWHTSIKPRKEYSRIAVDATFHDQRGMPSIWLKKGKANTVLPNSEKKVLELAARAIKLRYLMYMPATYPHRSGLLYNKEDGRAAMWNPLVDDGDIFRLAVAAPSVDLREVILSIPHAVQESLEIRCARVREAFVLKLAESVADAEAKNHENFADLKPVAEKAQQ